MAAEGTRIGLRKDEKKQFLHESISYRFHEGKSKIMCDGNKNDAKHKRHLPQ